jgi:hypothetical protein
MLRLSYVGSTLALALPSLVHAQDATTPGEPTAPFPTLTAISLEWPIEGDDDADGVVTVRFRAQGESSYRTGLPLVRVPAGSNAGFSWANRYAGSIFGLESATPYEIELTLADPDGGEATETLAVTTRGVPTAAPDATIVPVTPATIDGALAVAAPGTVLVLADGTYGEIVVPVDGAAGQPIVLRSENPGGALVAGDIRIDGRAHVIVEGLTVQGKFKFNDADSIVVRGCTITTPEHGIVSYGTGVRNALILDNLIEGPTVWYEGALGVDGDNLGEGVQLTGPGNVIAFNRVRGFRDCVSLLEDGEAEQQTSVDIYGNDLSECADDAIEADFGMGNVRVHHNRITNSFMGISSQPSLGGPTYMIRNVMYNVVYSPFKLQRSSVGDVGYHNTIVKSGDAFAVYTSDVWSRATFRNNLFLGGPGADHNGYDSGPGDVMVLPAAAPSCSFDYDGFGSIGTGTFRGEVGGVDFDGLAQLQTLTTEANALEVGLDIFADPPAFPADPFAAPTSFSFTLAPASAPVDHGLGLPNVNDAFAGSGPDLGAYELGAELPVYGPGGTLGGGAGGAGGGGAGPGAGGSSGGGGDTGAGAGSEGGSSNGEGASSGGASSEDGGEGCDCTTPPTSSRHPWSAAVFLALAAWWRARARFG